jgi:methionyl-tRNA formyltransferase
MNKTPVVFFGNERIATGVTTSAPTLTALINAGYDVKAVVSNYERANSRSARQLEIQTVADANNISVLLPAKPSDIANKLIAYGAEVAILVAYGKIVPQHIIDIFPLGIINIHPSLLPLHRGPTPLESVILNGELETGVSVMQLVKAMDAGPTYLQRPIKLTGTETKQQLADKLLTTGAEMVTELLPRVLDGSATPTPQDDSKATYDKLITKEDGIVDWSKPAALIEREIRAFAEWPKSSAQIAGKEVTLTAAHPIPDTGKVGSIELHGKDLVVFCGEGALVIERLKPAGKNEMTAEAFLAGHKHLLK